MFSYLFFSEDHTIFDAHAKKRVRDQHVEEFIACAYHRGRLGYGVDQRSNQQEHMFMDQLWWSVPAWPDSDSVSSILLINNFIQKIDRLTY